MERRIDVSCNQPELIRSNTTNTSEKYSFFDFVQKPIEVFIFIDPICPDSWSLEPSFKKLFIEYGRFFTFRPIICGNLNTFNRDSSSIPNNLKDRWEKTAKRTGMSCDGDIWIDNPIASPWLASLAIKAAELQGKKAGRIFLRRLQESVFVSKQNISDEKVLLQCAKYANLDIEEFRDDLYSPSAKKALQCDLKLAHEMEIDHTPTIVFFNQLVEEQGIKISGVHPYENYVLVLKEILQKNPVPSEKPPLEHFLSFYKLVASKEISVVYDWTAKKTEQEMKKLQLKQIVQKIPAKYGSFWRYIG